MPRPTAQPGTPARHVRPGRSWPLPRAVAALMLREMSVTYGRSPGGYLWAVLEPAAGICLLTLLFSLAFEAPPLGRSFPLFYATGLVPFLFYSDLSTRLAQALRYSRQLLTYPSVTFIDALMARFLLNALTLLMVGYMIFAALLTALDTRAVLSPDRLALAYAMAASLALGVGTMNCILVSVLPVWQQIWAIFNRPLFLVSCVFFVYDGLPEPWRGYLWWNPLIHVVGTMRSAFYPTYDAAYVSPVYIFALSLTLLVLGLVFLIRYHRDIIHG
ncbi:ABC transporter permease [Rhodobacterales bacterium HKCCE3408]|nr:ABC transporter permease [Rhodobacterales bacterium HKCCE3408]